MEKKMEDEKRTKIITNALKYYLGMPLRLEEATSVFRLIQKFKVNYVNLKLTEQEKATVLKALNKHMKRFFRIDATIDVARLIQETSAPVRNSRADEWVLHN